MVKQTLCDVCGKVMEDFYGTLYMNQRNQSFSIPSDEPRSSKLDLCTECVEKIRKFLLSE